MDIFTCPDCRDQISSSAKACPHCGARKPGVTIVFVVALCGAIFLLLCLLVSPLLLLLCPLLLVIFLVWPSTLFKVLFILCIIEAGFLVFLAAMGSKPAHAGSCRHFSDGQDSVTACY